MSSMDTLHGFKKKKEKGCFISINGEKFDLDQSSILQLLDKNYKDDFSKEVVTLLSKLSEKKEPQPPVNLPVAKWKAKYILDEKKKTVYGIKVGETKRHEAYGVLKRIIESEINFDYSSSKMEIAELGITLHFSENDIVDEIILGEGFKGETTKGLRIGSSMETAIQLHGEPRMNSLVSGIWNDFLVFIKDQVITGIKIKT